MGMDTLTFSFLFLPAAMATFYIIPQKYKNTVLAIASLLFYAANDPGNLLLLVVSVIFDFMVCAKLVRSTGEQIGSRNTVFWISVVKNIAMMVGTMAMWQLGKAAMPLGLMVYTVTSMGYVIDVYNGDERFDGSVVDYIVFTAFWGKLYAGPIVQYSQLKSQWETREISSQRIKQGLRFYIGGLARLVILAGGMNRLQEQLALLPKANKTVLSVWVIVICTTFELYYTLTGYCDMARGLANLFGMDFPENFHYPFQSRTVSDFFNRFNITVTKFINRYVYVFLGADTNGVLPTMANTLLTTMLMGMWFGLKLNFLVWGIYFALFILLERYFLMRYLAKIPPIVDRIYTFVVVMLSFTIFSGSSLRDTAQTLGEMFGRGGLPLLDSQIVYLISTNYLVILLNFFFATSLTAAIGSYLHKKYPRFTDTVSGFLSAGILVATVSLMV